MSPLSTSDKIYRERQFLLVNFAAALRQNFQATVFIQTRMHRETNFELETIATVKTIAIFYIMPHQLILNNTCLWLIVG